MNGPPNPLADRLGNIADASVPLAPVAPKRAPGSVLVFDNATGEQRDMSPEDATAAFKAGAVNLVKNHPIGIVDADGETHLTNTDDASAALAKGGSLVGADVAHHAELAREYSGAKGTALAFGLGLDSMATHGTVAALAELAAGDAGNDAGDEYNPMREALATAKDEHPIASALGSVGGALFGGLGKAGGAIEEGVEGALGRVTRGAIVPDASALGARALSKAAGGAARGIAEGAAIDLSSAMSENAINDGDHQLTGEQLVARIGHGALLGGVLGGIAGGSIEGAKTAVNAAREGAAPLAENLANKEMWRDLNAAQTVSRKVLSRVEGGEAAIGKTARSIGLDDPMLSVPEQLAKAEAAKQETGKAIGDMYRSSAATGTARPLLKKLDGLIEDVDGIAGASNVAAGLKKYRAEFLDKVTKSAVESGAPIEETTTKAVAWDPESGEQRLLDEIERLTKNGAQDRADALETLRHEQFGPRNLVDVKTNRPVTAAEVVDHPISMGELWDQRRGLDRLLKFESARDPEQRIQLLRDFRSHFQGYLEDTGEKAAAAAGKEFAAPLKALSEKYSHLSYINEALETKVVRQLSNRRFSLTDSIMQGSGNSAATTALMTGHPLVAAGALLSGLANKAMRQQGPRIAAYLLGRTSSLEDVAIHVGHVDDAIARAATGLLERPSPPVSGTFQRVSPPLERVANAKHEDVRGRFDELATNVRQAAAHPALATHVDAQLADVAQHAPEAAKAARATTVAATKYLADTLPVQVVLDPLQPDKFSPAPFSAMSRWLRRYDVINDPEILFKQVSARSIDPAQLEAFQAVYPAVNARLQHAVMGSLLADPSRFSRSERLALGPVVGTALTPASSPATAMSRQAMYADASPPPGQGGGQEKPRGSRKAQGASRETASDQIEKGD